MNHKARPTDYPSGFKRRPSVADPSGFKRGDNHLRVMPGSHKISAFVPELEGPELQRGSDHETALIDTFGLTPLELELPPGSMARPNPSRAALVHSPSGS